MFRQIIHPLTNKDLVIQLPKEYLSKEVEIIAFEIEARTTTAAPTDEEHKEKVRKAFEVFDKYRFKGIDFKMTREERNER